MTYEVYRAADQLFFTPAAPYATGITANTYTDLDPNVIGNVLHPAYYLIRAVSSGLAPADSNRVGCFSFGRAPGSP